jgi:hypothetical protein
MSQKKLIRLCTLTKIQIYLDYYIQNFIEIWGGHIDCCTDMTWHDPNIKCIVTITVLYLRKYLNKSCTLSEDISFQYIKTRLHGASTATIL